jgi:hypothetical protein
MGWQAYVDDSWGPAGVYVLAGYVASDEQWETLTQQWRRWLPLGSLDDNDEHHFKMSEMALSDERMSRVSAFHDIINSNVAMGLSIALRIDDIQAAINRLRVVGPIGAQLEIDSASPFTVAAPFLINGLNSFRTDSNFPLPADATIDFVFDEMTDKASVLDNWETWIGTVPEELAPYYGALPRFEDDKKCLPLQAADFRAWWVRETIEKSGNLSSAKINFPYVRRNLKLKCAHMGITQDNIVDHVIAASKIRGVTLEDAGPADHADGPSPIQKAAERLRQLFRSRRTMRAQ